MESESCPTDQTLESFILDETSDSLIAHHIEHCEYCRRRLEDIRANNEFLNHFAQVVAIDDLPYAQTRSHVDEPLPEILPGGYRIEGEIHRGGHGVVYRATQIQTNRVVALKMLILGTSATPRQRLRFEREAEIVAGLRHPGIVTIYDAGYLDDGRFGFAMEFVEGVTLDQWAAQFLIESKNDVHARIGVFLSICEAVNFAHQYGVVHRDLKPANILIDKGSNPHILDFGIAKVLREEMDKAPVFGSSKMQDQSSCVDVEHTLPGEFSGTLSYASPEQVSGDPTSIDLRTDVYSLGVLLYELLSGELPYSISGSVAQVIERISSDVPKPLFGKSSGIDRDLSEIVLHAVEKEKQNRYESVHELSRDLENYLEGKPIEIRRNSAWYVVRKTVRRRWIPVATISIVMVLVTGIAILMTVLYFEKRRAETEANLQLRSLNLALAHIEGKGGSGSLAIDMLWQAQLSSTRGMSSPQPLLFGSGFEPIDSYWELWDFYSRNPSIGVIEMENGAENSVDVSPDQKTVVSYTQGQLSFYSIHEHKPARTVQVELPQWFIIQSMDIQIRYSHNGQSVYAFGENGIVEWDIESGVLLSSKKVAASLPSEARGMHSGGVVTISFGHKFRVLDPQENFDEIAVDAGEGEATTAKLNVDGTLLATSTIRLIDYQHYQSTLSVWSLPAGERVARYLFDGAAQNLLFASDDQSILISNPNGTEKLRWDMATDSAPTVVLRTDDFSTPILWLDDDTKLVCVQSDSSISIWDMVTGERLSHYFGQSGPVRQVVSQESKSHLVSITDQSIRTWDIQPQPWSSVQEPSSVSNHDVAISLDGSSLAWTINEIGNYRVVVVDSKDKTKMLEFPGTTDLITSLAFDWLGKTVVSATYDGQVSLWDIQQRQLIKTFRDHDSGVHSIDMSPTQNMLVSGGDDGAVVLRNLDNDEIRTLGRHRKRVPKVVFRHDGRVVASCSIDGMIRLWEVDSGELLQEFGLHQRIHTIALSPDGATIAAGGRGKMITLIDLNTNTQRHIQGDLGVIYSLAFGPQGRVIISGDQAGDLSVWDIETGRRLIRLPKHEQMVMAIAINPDGRSMVTCSAGLNPEIRIWHLDAFAHHIAGNLEYHGARLERESHKKPANLDAMRAWADKIRGPQQ